MITIYAKPGKNCDSKRFEKFKAFNAHRFTEDDGFKLVKNDERGVPIYAIDFDTNEGAVKFSGWLGKWAGFKWSKTLERIEKYRVQFEPWMVQ